MGKFAAEMPPELSEKLRQTFDETQLVELVADMAWQNYRARFNRVFGVWPVSSSDGAYCVLPEMSKERTSA